MDIVTVVVAVFCGMLLYANIALIRERKRLRGDRHPRGPALVRDDAIPPAKPRERPEQSVTFVQQEYERIKQNLLNQFPQLTPGERARAAKEILEKARITLAKIP